MTIADVIKMNYNESIDLLMMHRNFCDALGSPSGKTVYITDAAKSCKCTFTKQCGLGGQLTFYNIEFTDVTFEFDLEYMPGYWYPLRFGVLPPSDPDKIVVFPWEGQRCIPWTEFSLETRIGWRGPCMPWSVAEKIPKVQIE